jgi:hypothetical protein
MYPSADKRQGLERYKGRYAFHLEEKSARISWPENEIFLLAALERAHLYVQPDTMCIPWWMLIALPGGRGSFRGKMELP